ncbi:MAG: DUF2273 domain-containing protein [Atopobiaceae bacterium]|jgi:uncharacterized membrane protein
MTEKKPRMKIEDATTDPAAGADAFGHGHESQEASGGQDEQGSLRGVTHTVSSWLTTTFPGHEMAVLFGFLGFVLAILIFVIGFLKSLFVVIVVVLGVAIGQVFDGDPKIFRAIRRVLGGSRD